MKVGLLGAGRIGTFHARTLVSDPRITSVQIADAIPERARTLAAD